MAQITPTPKEGPFVPPKMAPAQIKQILLDEVCFGYNGTVERALEMGWLDEPENFRGDDDLPTERVLEDLTDETGRITGTRWITVPRFRLAIMEVPEPATYIDPTAGDVPIEKRNGEATCTGCFLIKARHLLSDGLCRDCA